MRAIPMGVAQKIVDAIMVDDMRPARGIQGQGSAAPKKFLGIVGHYLEMAALVVEASVAQAVVAGLAIGEMDTVLPVQGLRDPLRRPHMPPMKQSYSDGKV